MQQVLSFDNGLKLVQATNGITNRGISQGTLLNGLLNSEPALQTIFPAGNPLADQMKMVARIIGVRSQLGLNRQIFYCSLDGFDTHCGQSPIQTPLLQQQYASTLAQRFGVPAASVPTVLPNLQNFAVQKLGFLG